jgi:sodium-dependent dicarboxylate transporter 2/3/5
MMNRWRAVSFLIGPLLGCLVGWLIPDGLIHTAAEMHAAGVGARVVAALLCWMSVWWAFEPISIYATALLPLVVLPLFGIATMSEVAQQYANPLSVLFLGGFVLALALERWKLHVRFSTIILRRFGGSPRQIAFMVMALCATTSMWISNTSTTLMMLPIAASISEQLDSVYTDSKNHRIILVLGVAYASSIGGVATLVGSPPNAIAAAFLQNSLNTPIGFLEWMRVGVPVVVVMLPLAWFALTSLIFPMPAISGDECQKRLLSILEAPRRMRQPELLVLIVFVGTALAWMLRGSIAGLTLFGQQPFMHLSDSGIAIASAFLLFVLPVNRHCSSFLMDWGTASKAPWGLFLLMGAGLSLAQSIQGSGLDQLISRGAGVLFGFGVVMMLVLIVVMTVFLTEITSNTATTTMMLPIIVIISELHGGDASILIVPAAISSSFAFMLPSATAPNALAYATGKVNSQEMLKAGFWLNCLGVVVLLLLFVPMLLLQNG